MDQYNVINITSNLLDLENDMRAWSNMPFERRMRSDEDCIRLYGVTNIELFNRLKTLLVSNNLPTDEELLKTSVSEGFDMQSAGLVPTFDFLDDEAQVLLWKKQMVEQLNMSPTVALLSPAHDTVEKLDEIYNKYLLLNDKFKRISNGYSLDFWGYNVPNMYIILKDTIAPDIQLDNKVNLRLQESLLIRQEEDKYSVYESCDDKVGMLVEKLDFCAPMKRSMKSQVDRIVENINYSLEDTDYSAILPAVTPYFTVSEMREICPDYSIDIEPDQYFNTVAGLMKKYHEAVGEEKVELESAIINLGWNPSVDFTPKNIEFARERQVRWLRENVARVIDVTDLAVSESVLTESTKAMREQYKEKNLYPVYLVLSFSHTVFGRIIRKVKHCDYSHAGMALDSDLADILTFKFWTDTNGFNEENLFTYLDKSENAVISVLALFVDKGTKERLEAVVEDFVNKKKKTRYGFGNLFYILRGKEKQSKDNLALVCSQFVDTVFKLANLDITGKPSNLVIPQDLANLEKRPKVFKVYEGLAREYSDKDVENKISQLMKTYSLKDLRYTELMDNIKDDLTIESVYSVTENVEANLVLEEMRELLRPTVAIYEKKLPVKISDEGDITINFSKSLEQEYQDSHKLLTTYTVANTEGIKHELAKMFYINATIEKKIKKMKKDDEEYKPLIDLRARVLNDFKKYFKQISEDDPDFNFDEYYKKSEFYDSSITIDKSTLKYSGSVIKDLIGKVFKKKK